MLLKTAIRIILHEKTKFAGAVAGVTLAMSLVLLQWGFYLGYKRDTTVVINLFDADLWIVPKGQTSIDSFTTIDDLAYWKAKELPQIESAVRVVWSLAPFRHGVNGSAQRIQLLGVDFDSGVRVNLETADKDLATSLRPDGCVLVGSKSRRQLGIAAPDPLPTRSAGAPRPATGRRSAAAGRPSSASWKTSASSRPWALWPPVWTTPGNSSGCPPRT